MVRPPRSAAPLARVLLALYSGAAFVFLFLAAPWFWWRSRRDPGLRASLPGRLGRGEGRAQEPTCRPCVWVHAVSVGEQRLARHLIHELAARRPDLDVAVSATTTAGLALARELHPRRFVFQFPLDARFAVRRTFERVRPAALVLVELELWPNVMNEARRRDVPVAVVNGRISKRSSARYRRLERLLPQFAQIERFAAQDDEYAARALELGVPQDRVVVTGNLKYDALRTTSDPARVTRLRADLGLGEGARVLVGGSTHPGEEALLVEHLPQLERAAPGLRLVLVPRHVERAAEVARVIERAGRRPCRLTELRAASTRPPADGADGAVVIVDTIGELEAVYALAELVFVGGSLVPRGGQNMLEPAALGRPTLFGPGTENFQREVALLRSHRGAIEVANAAELGRGLARLLADPAGARELGERGRAAVAGLRGGTERTLAVLLPWLDTRAAKGDSVRK